MKQINLFSLALVIVLICTIDEVSFSQPYAITRSVLGSGGVEISGAGNRIIGTVGQSIIGVTQNSSNKKFLGFWYTKNNIATEIKNISEPYQVTLSQNYPNPVSLSSGISTTFIYSINKLSVVDLSIFDMMGRKINTLTMGMYQAGTYAVQFSPDLSLSSGMYTAILRVTQSDNVVIIKSKIITLMK